MRTQGHIGCVALLACFLVGCQGLAIGGRTRPVPILAQTQADDSGFQHAAAELINSQAELEAFGSTTLDEFDVDFEAHSLLVLALGERPTGGWSAHITGVQTSGSELFLQVIVYEPPEGSLVDDVPSYPIAATVIPKLEAELIHPEVEEVEGYAPDEWIED